MDEATLALLGTLVEIKTELGTDVYEAALDRARLALAAEVMVEAERRAIRTRGQRTSGHSTGDVIAFPGNPRHGSN